MMDISSLPPMPDRESGEPRPPRAPLDLSWGWPEDKDRERNRGRMPAPPSGQGPVLEWYQTSRRGAFYAGASMSLLLVGFLTLRDWGFGWTRVWWLWLIILVFSLLVLFGVRGNPMAAGADWYRRGRVWIKTYELVSARVIKAWASDNLELKDAEGGEVSVKLTTIQQNRELWDLVYNGILHSVHTRRARTNQLARERLNLPEGLPVGAEDGQPQERVSAPPRRVSKASRVAHIVLAILSVCAGILILASVAGFIFSGEAFKGVFNIAFSIFLVAVGAGFIWGYVWLKRRLER